MSRLDNCLTAIVGDKLPIETARKTFFFLLGIAVMLIVIALPSPSPFYKGEEAIPLTANAKIVMAVLCFAVIQWMTEAKTEEEMLTMDEVFKRMEERVATIQDAFAKLKKELHHEL